MIIEPQILLEFRCKLEALITEREGMLLANRDREARAEAPAYYEDHFFILSNKIEELGKQLITLCEK